MAPFSNSDSRVLSLSGSLCFDGGVGGGGVSGEDMCV